MTSEFTAEEWDRINAVFAADPAKYGFPKRIYGSALLASFNIRKLGKRSKRSANTWKFLAMLCRQFDLLAVQEIMDDLEGFDYLRELMGPDFHAVVSDRTGVFPGESGMGERLGFIYNTRVIERGDVVSDISFDRSKLIKTVIDNYDVLRDELLPYLKYLDKHKAWQQNQVGAEPKPPKVQIPVFLSFIRQPFCASFRIVGHPGTEPYKLMAINAHLYFGESVTDRRQEFDALMEWILGRVEEKDTAYYPNFVLMGDLNLDFDNPKTDRERITAHIKTFNAQVKTSDSRANVYFPFLDPHPVHNQLFRTNARLKETFDHVAFFSHDGRLPQSIQQDMMGAQERGPDYGMVNFVQLFSDALNDQPLLELTSAEKAVFYRKFEHEVSDHMPIWVRLPLPDAFLHD
ncbi:endonuclease exonuclease phosphatase family protein [Leptolyngbya sp. Heron Island J]|uniref:endonuclease/exonuclease/phosphatase family protein n=1 Tax=Leptolyngbya sp. Heron Island J TaxID=1385935 RepID=UPI0003B9D236|nr:endonuclease/exonuclease/phosphatase family protein [Leptolyngbya sp. Heron Island J]ESA35220.1 endonuclease exonuclease phosphatase family protein [Leptolyngbya sp. Heron Island J]